MPVLWAYAHPKEARGLALRDAVQLGVGKIEAASRLTERIVKQRPEAVIGFGIAGAFPGHGLDVGDLCLVTEETLADEGVATSEGFEDLVSLKFTTVPSYWADPELTDELAAALEGPPRVRGTTVSTCSGTDAVAQAYAERVDAAVETMEGAAVASVCARFGVPWAQVRSISNRTGDRDRGGWDLARSLARLHAALAGVQGW